MGFFDFLNPLPLIQSVVRNPLEGLKGFSTVVATGGLSLVSPEIRKTVNQFTGQLYNPQTALAIASLVNPVTRTTYTASQLRTAAQSSAYPLGIYAGPDRQYPTFELAQAAVDKASGIQRITPPGTNFISGGNMGLDLSGILNTVGSIFGGNQNPVFQGISNVASIASQYTQPGAFPVANRQQPAVTGPIMRAVGTVGRGFFNKFPNLATAMQALRNQGRNVKRSQLYSMLKRFGPEVLISGGILTAAAVSELMVAGPGTRRMNAGNAKALRRSMRRIEAFHHLCVKADRLRAPRRRSCKTGRSSSGQTLIRQG